MKGCKPGQYVPLEWDAEPDFEIVAGHVAFDAAWEAYCSYTANGDADRSKWVIYHGWARYVTVEGREREVQLDEKRPFSFKVTVLQGQPWTIGEFYSGPDGGLYEVVSIDERGRAGIKRHRPYPAGMVNKRWVPAFWERVGSTESRPTGGV